MPEQKLFIAIVDRGRADPILQEIQPLGVSGGLVIYGEGTAPNRWLQILGLDRTQKEVIILSVADHMEKNLHDIFLHSFKFHKKNRGIVFSLPMNRFQDARYNPQDMRADIADYPYHLIVTILDKGSSQDCVRIARTYGAPGSTLIHGRGAGVPQNEYFDLVIEPHKDIVLSLTPSSKVEPVANALIDQLGLNKPAAGVLFVLPVSLTTGVYVDPKQDIIQQEAKDERITG